MIGHGHARSERRDEDRSRPIRALPDALFRRLRVQTGARGEVRLALAVLEDAVRCFERYPGARKFLPLLIRWEAEQWFASRDREPLFSFENVCSVLRLDAEVIREQVLGWRLRRRHESTRRFSGSPRRESLGFLPLRERSDAFVARNGESC
jgi:hypothetical protein